MPLVERPARVWAKREAKMPLVERPARVWAKREAKMPLIERPAFFKSKSYLWADSF
ncbi:hypothetical protein GCM10010912_06970 [Paenibacillus albidus]|uniref:Uncharacterized protein n=1 Tax=Paenibacillus albidus TaxID=2041023 RepID=A0A917FBZ0_9BACL|nr:hypothetical protein GCM10010912_06970 [Paenibacillus albidus]